VNVPGGDMVRAAAFCLVAALCFGISVPLAKPLLEDAHPLALAGLLYLGGALAVLPVSHRGSSRALRHAPRELALLAGAVVFGGMLGPVLLLLGLRAAPAGSVSLWLNLETVATALFAWALFREHLGSRVLAATALLLAGGALLALPFDGTNARAALLVAAACACWGLDNNCTALISGYTPAQTTLIKGLVAGSANLLLARILGVPFPPLPVVAIALLVGAVAYGVSILLYVKGAQHLGATRSQILFSSAPYFGLAASWIVLREPLGAAQGAAAVTMAAGIALMLTGRHEHAHAHAAIEHTHEHRHDDEHHDHDHEDLAATTRHTHPHVHGARAHAHPHAPDLHHRHDHGGAGPGRAG
jgi:drug/metabolite transporter (DMT)-like permease